MFSQNRTTSDKCTALKFVEKQLKGYSQKFEVERSKNRYFQGTLKASVKYTDCIPPSIAALAYLVCLFYLSATSIKGTF
jgi:hypothetical protein